MSTLVPLKQITVKPDRARKIFKNIAELSETIKSDGLVQPLVVHALPNGRFELIAGERRYRACVMAGLPEVPIEIKVDPTPLQLLKFELIENQYREDLTFEEEGELYTKIKREMTAERQGKEPTLEEISDVVQKSKSTVGAKIKLKEAIDKDPELRKLVEGKPAAVAEKIIEQHKKRASSERLIEQGKLVVTSEILHGDCRELIKTLPDNSVDLLLTDPPYGLEKLEAMRESSDVKQIGHQLMSDTHNQDLESVLELLRTLAPELARVLKPGAHWYVFTAFQYIHPFIEALAPLEFQPPIVVWKRNKSTGAGLGYNYLSCLESCIYGFNPPRTRRLYHNKFNLFEEPDVPRNLRRYPTEKPVPLLAEFIQNSSDKGGVVLDPCCGSGSTLEAAKRCGRTAIGFEIDRGAYLIAQNRLDSLDE